MMKDIVDMNLLKKYSDMFGPQVSNRIFYFIICMFVFLAVLAIVCTPISVIVIFGVASIITVSAGVICTSANLIEHIVTNTRLADPPAISRKWIQKSQSVAYLQGEYFAVNNNRIMIRICTTTRWKQICMYDDRMHPRVNRMHFRVLWDTPPQERPKAPPGKMKMNQLI